MQLTMMMIVYEEGKATRKRRQWKGNSGKSHLAENCQHSSQYEKGTTIIWHHITHITILQLTQALPVHATGPRSRGNVHDGSQVDEDDVAPPSLANGSVYVQALATAVAS